MQMEMSQSLVEIRGMKYQLEIYRSCRLDPQWHVRQCHKPIDNQLNCSSLLIHAQDATQKSRLNPKRKILQIKRQQGSYNTYTQEMHTQTTRENGHIKQSALIKQNTWDTKSNSLKRH